MQFQFDSIDGEEEAPEGLMETADVLNKPDNGATRFEFDSIDDDPTEDFKIDQALQLTPETHQRNKEIAESTGVPEDVVQRDDGQLERMTRSNELKDALMLSPILKYWFGKDDNASVSYDDIKPLSNIEAVFKFGYNMLDRGFTRAEQGYNYFVGEEAAEQTSDVEKSFLDILRDEAHSGVGLRLPFWEDSPAIPTAFDLFNATERYATSRVFGGAEETAKQRFARAGERGRVMAGIPKSETATTFQDNVVAAEKDGPLAIIEAIVSDPLGALAFGAEVGGEFLPQIAVASAVTMATRNPMAGAVVMGGGSYATERFASPIEYLQKQGIELTKPEDVIKLISDSKLLATAKEYGWTRGSIIGALDTFSGGLASKVFFKGPMRNMLSQMFVQAGLGGGGEGLAQVGTEGHVTSWAEVALEAVGEFSTAPLDVVGVGGQYYQEISHLGGLVDGVKYKIGNFNVTFGERLKKSKIGTQILKQTVKFAESSKTRERSKEHFKKFVKAQADEVGSDSVYVDPEGAEKLLQSSSPTNSYDKTISTEEAGTPISDETKNNPTVKKILADIQKAKEEGRNIKIPLEEYLADIPGSEIQNKLAEHSKLRNDLLTPSEEKNIDLEAEAKKSTEEKTIQQVEEAEVHADIVQKAVDLGMPRSEATQNADYLALLLKRQADEEGISIKKLYDDNKLKTRTEIPGETVVTEDMLNQQAAEFGVEPEVLAKELEEAGGDITQTPRFKEWFGESILGNPVYHGTASDIGSFKLEHQEDVGFHFGTPDQANSRVATVAPESISGQMVMDDMRIPESEQKEYWANLTSEERDQHIVDLRAKTTSGANVLPVYLSLKNPLRLQENREKRFRPDDILIDIRNSVETDSPLVEMSEKEIDGLFDDVLKINGRGKNYFEIDDATKKIEFMQKFLESKGFDGLVYENKVEGEGDSYAVFNPSQIKSIYNRGTFSSKTGEILKQSTPLESRPIDEIMTTTVQQSSEALPSTGLLAGRMIKNMDQSIQELYQEEVNKLSDKLVEQITGLVRVDSTNSPSRFDGHIGASQQIRYKVETMKDENGKPVLTPEYAEKIKMAAAIKGYIQDQDAVVNSFFSSVTDESQADVYSIDIGRVLTHEEMVAVDQKIAEVSKKLGINPDHIATPTTAEGVDLLNVSGPWADVEATQLHLKEIYVSVSEVLNAKGGTFFKNVLRDTGYIGGFDGYKSGQEVYQKIRDSASGGNSGGGRSEEQWWGHSDRVEAKRAEIRGFTEKFIKDNPLPTKTIRQIGEESDALAKKEKRVISAKDFSKKAELSIADQMFTEALSILRGGDKDARGWYTTRFQQALDSMGQKHPELLKDKTARNLYTTFTAITSDGARVSINMKFANAVYESYKKTGKVNEHIPSGERSASYKTNLNFLQRQIDEKGLEGAMKYLGGHELVSKLENDLGVKSTGFSKTAHLPRSTIFGPKLGLFWANLMGQPDYLTMDRWWSRTFNRYRGKMTADPTTKQIETFKKLLGRPTARMSTVVKEAKRITKGFAKRRFKNGTPLEKAANIIHKTMTGLIDAPAGVGDRAFQFAVTDRVVKELKTEVKDEDGNVTREAYPDMTVSDLQAVLWYGEKRRMREMGSKSPIDEVDFADVAEQVIKENNKANVLLQSEDGSTRGYFNLNTNEMTFTKNADLTTFIHEASHYFLSLLHKLKDGSPRVQAELAVLDKWFSENGAVTDKEKHEMFASGQEQYLMEGNAPTKELQRMFSRFKSWIRAVYKRMSSSPFASNGMQGVELSDEVRGVFDRMLASDEAIAQARKEQSYDSMPLQEIGLDEESYAEHQKLRSDAADEADADLTAQLIKDLKRQKAKWWKEEIAPIIESIREKVSQQKDYVTRDWLTGENIPEGGSPVKLNKAYIEEFYDKEAKADLKSMTSEDGMNPDQLAEYFEYSSGDEMIQALLETKKPAERESYIRALAEQEMLTRHPDTLNDFGLKTDKANETVHNEKQAELLALELRMLNIKVGKGFATKGTPKDVRGVYRAAAEKAVSEMTVGDMKPEIYLANERKHGRDAFKFATDGKWVEARDAKHKQMRQFYMYKEALKAKKKADKMASTLRGWQVKKFDPKKVNPDFIKQVKALLSGIHFGKKIGEKRVATLERKTLEAWAEQQEKEYGARFHISAELDNALNKDHYGEMTFEDLRGLHDTVKSILAQGKKFSDIEKAIFSKNMEEGAKSIKKNDTKKHINPDEMDWKDKLTSFGRKYFASHRSVESQSIELDRSTFGGWVHRNIYLPVKRADDNYINRSMEAGEKLNEILSVYNSENFILKGLNTGKEKFAMQRKKFIPGYGGSLSLVGRLVFVLNLGNSGNVAAMENQYTQDQMDSVVSTLTDKDWDVVEAIWEHINTYWNDTLDAEGNVIAEGIATVEERTTGVKPPKVEAVPFTTPSGRVISGGYFPLIANPAKGEGKKDYEQSQTLDGFMKKGRAKMSTKHGSTIARVGWGQERVIWLDFGVIFSHIDGVIKDIEMREAVAMADRRIRNIDFINAVSSAKGPEFHDTYTKWLEAVAGASPTPLDWSDEVALWMRTGVSIAEMGLSPRTVLQQPFGMTQTVAMIGEKYTAKGIARFMANPIEATKAAMALSKALRHRGGTFNRDTRDAHRSLGVKGLNESVVTAAFWGVQKLDMAVSVPSWWGAYMKAEEVVGLTGQDAIDYANSVVERGQGGGREVNLAGVQNQKGIKRVLVMFYSFFSAYYNLQVNLTKDTDFTDGKQAIKYAKNQVWITIIPALLVDALFNGGPEDDEEWYKWMASTLGSYTAGTLVGFRDIAGAAITGFAYQMSPAGNVGKSIMNFMTQAGQGELDEAMVKAGIMMASYVAHIPGGRAANRFYTVIKDEGTEAMESFDGWWRLLVQGKKR
jgi:hypothetical protein